MLAIDVFHRHHTFADPANMDQGVRDSYTGLAFSEYGFSDSMSASSFSTLPYSYYDTQALAAGQHATAMSNPYLKTANFSSADNPPSIVSSASAPSIQSSSSSPSGSPYSGPSHTLPYQDSWHTSQTGLGLDPTIVPTESYGYDFAPTDFDSDLKFQMQKPTINGVDPSLIHSPHLSAMHQNNSFSTESMYPNLPNNRFASYSPVPSPALSQHAIPATLYPGSQFAPVQSPQLPYNAFDPTPMIRASSVISDHSYQSQQSPRSASFETDEEGRQRGRCPHPDCGRVFKDLKAHMLTHQSERPEKCPILTCEYNQKGFARKYDKNRHTLTHYKGTMVCGFCPGSGSAAEKSFNRADVFKRHLTSVHGVEQTPPNSRKRSPGSNKKLSSYCQDATGKCSTCSATFNNAQDFYEHLDDCVLRVVQQEEPSEAINQQHLMAISGDSAVKQTLDRHMLSHIDHVKVEDQEEEEEDEDEEDEQDESSSNDRSGRGQLKATKPNHSRVVLGANSAIAKNKGVRKGLTFSKGGVPLAGKGRKKRKHYPPSWGMSPDKMKMKKRVLCVYDGPRRLWKDDMMLDNEFEVRMKLGDGNSYVTDLDVETLKRAEAFHGATKEERGPWMLEEGQQFDLSELMA